MFKHPQRCPSYSQPRSSAEAVNEVLAILEEDQNNTANKVANLQKKLVEVERQLSIEKAKTDANIWRKRYDSLQTNYGNLHPTLNHSNRTRRVEGEAHTKAIAHHKKTITVTNDRFENLEAMLSERDSQLADRDRQLANEKAQVIKVWAKVKVNTAAEGRKRKAGDDAGGQESKRKMTASWLSGAKFLPACAW